MSQRALNTCVVRHVICDFNCFASSSSFFFVQKVGTRVQKSLTERGPFLLPFSLNIITFSFIFPR